MKKEEVLGEGLECSECGKVGCPRVIIWLDHLCKHFIALCHKCYPEFVKLVESPGSVAEEKEQTEIRIKGVHEFPIGGVIVETNMDLFNKETTVKILFEKWVGK